MSWRDGKGGDLRVVCTWGERVGPDTADTITVLMQAPCKGDVLLKRSPPVTKPEQKLAEAKTQQHLWPRLILTLHTAECNTNA